MGDINKCVSTPSLLANLKKAEEIATACDIPVTLPNLGDIATNSLDVGPLWDIEKVSAFVRILKDKGAPEAADAAQKASRVAQFYSDSKTHIVGPQNIESYRKVLVKAGNKKVSEATVIIQNNLNNMAYVMAEMAVLVVPAPAASSPASAPASAAALVEPPPGAPALTPSPTDYGPLGEYQWPAIIGAGVLFLGLTTLTVFSRRKSKIESIPVLNDAAEARNLLREMKTDPNADAAAIDHVIKTLNRVETSDLAKRSAPARLKVQATEAKRLRELIQSKEVDIKKLEDELSGTNPNDTTLSTKRKTLQRLRAEVLEHQTRHDSMDPAVIKASKLTFWQKFRKPAPPEEPRAASPEVTPPQTQPQTTPPPQTTGGTRTNKKTPPPRPK